MQKRKEKVIGCFFPPLLDELPADPRPVLRNQVVLREGSLDAPKYHEEKQIRRNMLVIAVDSTK